MKLPENRMARFRTRLRHKADNLTYKWMQDFIQEIVDETAVTLLSHEMQRLDARHDEIARQYRYCD
jgi:hypothetical protein